MRIISLILTIILLCPVSIVYADDYSSMTEQQLGEQLNQIRNELTARGLKAENKTVIYDNGEIQIYLSGPISVNRNKHLLIPTTIINNSKSDIVVRFQDGSVNGWSIDIYQGYFGSTLSSGKKSKYEIDMFYLSDCEVETYEEITDIEFTIEIDDNNYFGKKIQRKTIVKLYPPEKND